MSLSVSSFSEFCDGLPHLCDYTNNIYGNDDTYDASKLVVEYTTNNEVVDLLATNYQQFEIILMNVNRCRVTVSKPMFAKNMYFLNNTISEKCADNGIVWEPQFMFVPVIQNPRVTLRAFLENCMHEYNMMHGRIVVDRDSKTMRDIYKELERTPFFLQIIKKFNPAYFKQTVQEIPTFSKFIDVYNFSVFEVGSFTLTAVVCKKFNRSTRLKYKRQWPIMRVIIGYILDELRKGEGKIVLRGIKKYETDPVWKNTLLTAIFRAIRLEHGCLEHIKYDVSKKNRSWMDLFGLHMMKRQGKNHVALGTTVTLTKRGEVEKYIALFEHMLSKEGVDVYGIKAVKKERNEDNPDDDMCEAPSVRNYVIIHTLDTLLNIRADMQVEENHIKEDVDDTFYNAYDTLPPPSPLSYYPHGEFA